MLSFITHVFAILGGYQNINVSTSEVYVLTLLHLLAEDKQHDANDEDYEQAVGAHLYGT